jgi:outer membrane immunogenic protein
MRKIVFASIISFLAISSAGAADALIPIKAPPAPQYYDWSGIYVGAHAGHAWDRTQGSNVNYLGDFIDQKFRGWLGGAQIGVNHQIGRVVLGLELSGSWADAKGTSDCAVFHLAAGTSASCGAKQDWSAQLLARLGYAPGDGRFLPYILGGFGMAQLEATRQISNGVAGIPPVGMSTFTVGTTGTSAVHEGVILGAGAQYAISPRVSVGFDYLYGIYGIQEHGGVGQFRSVFNSGFGPVQVFTSNALISAPQNLTTQTARFVINFKLD